MDNQKIRLDIFVAKLKNISRIDAQKLILNNCVLINNKICTKKNQLIGDNEKIEIKDLILDKKIDIKNNTELPPYKKKLEIVYDDNDLFIVNKESGIIIHPTSFNEDNTLANIVKYYYDSNNIKTDLIDKNRMGICHRLDKDTSGLIVIAKNEKTYQLISAMFKENKIEKTYLALLNGILESGTIDVDAPIKRIDGTNKREVSQDFDAKNCFSKFQLIRSFKGFCLAQISIKTGRTHQIRVHAKFIKHNVINDPLYGASKKTTKYGQYLVANKLSFVHPITKKSIIVELKMPIEFEQYIKKYGGE